MPRKKSRSSQGIPCSNMREFDIAMALPGPSFKNTKEECPEIHLIARRAIQLYAKHDVKLNFMDIEMDITACHANGCALDLPKLRTFPDFDFMHDVSGIYRHLDRNTGKLLDCFVPRSAK